MGNNQSPLQGKERVYNTLLPTAVVFRKTHMLTQEEKDKLTDRLVAVGMGICTIVVVCAFFLLGVRVGLQVQLDQGLCHKLEQAK
jgi:hypothetical protein